MLITLTGYLTITLTTLHNREQAIDNLKMRAYISAKELANYQVDIILATEVFLQQLAQVADIQDPSAPHCSDFLAKILKLNPRFVNVGIPLPNGDLRCNALPLSRPVNVADRVYFQNAITHRQFSIGTFQHDRAAKTTSINFAYPVIEQPSNRLLGVAVAVVGLDWWSEKLKGSELPAGSVAYINDSSGKTIASYPERTRQSPPLALNTINTISTRSDSDGVQRVYSHLYLIKNSPSEYFTLSVGIPLGSALQIIHRHFYIALFMYTLIMLLLTWVVARMLRKGVLQPIEDLTTATQQLQKGVYQPITLGQGVMELKQLKSQFEQMARVRLEAEKKIWLQAHTDLLTGLPNRYMLNYQLADSIQSAQQQQHQLALLFLDLDNFKEINDTLGHDTGDDLLRKVAERIKRWLAEDGQVARQGGDEFTIMLVEQAAIEQINQRCDGLAELLRKPYQVDQNRLYITVSIGIAIYPEDGRTVEDLLKSADQAMFAAKREGRNRIRHFDQHMQSAIANKRAMINDLHTALKNQLVVYYQPIFDYASQRVNKAEALLRWQHPEKGMISPAEFIPLAEESGLIIKIGQWLFEQVCQDISTFKSVYGEEFQVSINVSPIQLADKETQPTRWIEILDQLQLRSRDIVIEITEGVMLDPKKETVNKLMTFRDSGIEVALDDFGTGYSSLAYIHQYDIDYLKIDRCFINNLTPESDALALCEAMILMAHKLGIKVVAEGVETREQASLLQQIGCDHLQGYLLSPPRPLSDFLASAPANLP